MKTLLYKIKKLQAPENNIGVTNILELNPSIATLEAALKLQKKKLKDILSGDLLEWMNENDQTVFETEDFKVAIKTFVFAKIGNTDAAFDWLISNQYGDLIRTSVDFPKGEFTEEAQYTLEKMGLSFTRKDGVHPQTLKKVISDRLAAGEDIPDEDNGIKVLYYDECSVKEK